MEINRAILIWFNSLADIPTIETLSIFFADLPIFFLPVFLLTAWLYYTFKCKNIEKKNELLVIFYACVVAVLINLFIQNIFDVWRPEDAIKNIGKLLLNHVPDASFPSDHASVWFAFITSLYLFWYKKTSFTYLPFALIMVISRIVSWIHWPFDILVWIIIWIFSWIWLYYFRKSETIITLNQCLIQIATFLKL